MNFGLNDWANNLKNTIAKSFDAPKSNDDEDQLNEITGSVDKAIADYEAKKAQNDATLAANPAIGTQPVIGSPEENAASEAVTGGPTADANAKPDPKKFTYISGNKTIPLANAYDLIKGYEGDGSVEGKKGQAYQDSNNNHYWTIGYGHKIGDGSYEAYKKSEYFNKTLNDDQMASLLRKDISSRVGEMVKPSMFGSEMYDMPPDLQKHMISAYFRGDWHQSPKAKELFKAGDLEGSARELLNNESYRKDLAQHPVGTKDRGIAGRMEDTANAIFAEAKRRKALQNGSSFQNAVDNQMSE